MELFEEELNEIEHAGIRYFLRKNPVREQEIRTNRADKIQKIKASVDEKNQYLLAHPKAKTDVALRKVIEKISVFKLNKIISCNISNRSISFETDDLALSETKKLDGCYVIKTNVSKQYLDKETAHSRYKDLAQVEFTFRTLKTTLENIRPIYVRTEENTGGHVFVASLAYMIIKYISDVTKELSYTTKFTFETLDKINFLQYTYEDKVIEIIPENLLTAQTQILKKLNIKLN
jgi:transposase